MCTFINIKMAQLDELFSKVRFSKRESKLNVDFQELEMNVKFQLPEDYKYYLTNYNSFEGIIGQEYLRLWNAYELNKLNQEYGIKNLPNTIAVGTNGSGEFIGIELKTNDYRVVLSPFIDLDKENNIEIGISFSDMLSRLYNGEQWFI